MRTIRLVEIWIAMFCAVGAISFIYLRLTSKIVKQMDESVLLFIELLAFFLLLFGTLFVMWRIR